jgi:hypothetical protein
MTTSWLPKSTDPGVVDFVMMTWPSYGVVPHRYTVSPELAALTAACTVV